MKKSRLQELAGLLHENQHGIEDIADEILEKLTSDTSLSNAGISLEDLNSQQERALSDALVNALMGSLSKETLSQMMK